MSDPRREYFNDDQIAEMDAGFPTDKAVKVDTTKKDVQMAYLRCRTAERVLDEHDAKRPNLHSGITSEYTQWENGRDVLQREERLRFSELMGILSVHLKDMAPPGPPAPPSRHQRDFA